MVSHENSKTMTGIRYILEALKCDLFMSAYQVKSMLCSKNTNFNRFGPRALTVAKFNEILMIILCTHLFLENRLFFYCFFRGLKILLSSDSCNCYYNASACALLHNQYVPRITIINPGNTKVLNKQINKCWRLGSTLPKVMGKIQKALSKIFLDFTIKTY